MNSQIRNLYTFLGVGDPLGQWPKLFLLLIACACMLCEAWRAVSPKYAVNSCTDVYAFSSSMYATIN